MVNFILKRICCDFLIYYFIFCIYLFVYEEFLKSFCNIFLIEMYIVVDYFIE